MSLRWSTRRHSTAARSLRIPCRHSRPELSDKPGAVQLTPEDVREVLDEVVEDVRLKLIANGTNPSDAAALAKRARTRVAVESKIGGPQVRALGSGVIGNAGLDILARELVNEHRMEAFGSLPDKMLAERLEAAGVPREQAVEWAHGKTYRDRDGLIVARHPGQPAGVQGQDAGRCFPAGLAHEPPRRHAAGCRQPAGRGPRRGALHHLILYREADVPTFRGKWGLTRRVSPHLHANLRASVPQRRFGGGWGLEL